MDAREALLRRRRALTQSASPRPTDPEARWTDYEAQAAPLSEAVRGEIAEIDAALARIRDGSYGVCVACGGPMGLQRLRAIPEARFCLGCSGHAPSE